MFTRWLPADYLESMWLQHDAFMNACFEISLFGRYSRETENMLTWMIILRWGIRDKRRSQSRHHVSRPEQTGGSFFVCRPIAGSGAWVFGGTSHPHPPDASDLGRFSRPLQAQSAFRPVKLPNDLHCILIVAESQLQKAIKTGMNFPTMSEVSRGTCGLLMPTLRC